MKLSDSIDRKFIESFNVSDWEVETENGFVDIISSNKTIEYEVYSVILENGLIINCADTHILIDENNQEVFAKDSLDHYIKTKQGISKVVEISNLGYSENMYDLSIDSEDHTYYTNDILSHNTTTTVGYILWYTLFQDNKNVAVVANKDETAREVLSRYQFMYEYLPIWMQQGVKTWNKGDVELENGSKVFTAATSSSGLRGKSCVTGDAKVCIEENGLISHVEIVSLVGIDLKNKKVLSKTGFVEFGGIIDQGIKPIIKLVFDDDSYLKCTLDHKLRCNDSWIESQDLKSGDILSNKTIVDIIPCPDEQVYDLYEVGDDHSYIANGVINHNCNMLVCDEVAIIPNNIADEFFASTYPVISAGKTTKIIMTSTPLGYNHFWKFWNDANNKQNDFVPFTAPYWKVPGRDEKWAEEQLRLLGEVKYNQEVACLGGEAKITLKDTETGEIFETTLEQAHSLL